MNTQLIDNRTPYAAFCAVLSALMILSVASKAPIAVLFAQMASLPVIFSAIALTPHITALPLLLVLIGFSAISTKLMLIYGVSVVLPSLWLGYLTVYSKKFTVKIKNNNNNLPQIAEVTYYNSTSYILSLLALFGITIAANFVILFAVPIDFLYDKILPIFIQMKTADVVPEPLIELLKDPEMRNSFMQAIPIAVLILWYCSTVASYYIAGRLAKYFKLLTRPWPNFVREYELSTVIILCTVAALVSMFLPYPVNYIAEFATSLFMILWIFAGLCAVHHFAKSFNMPTLFLSLFYMALIIFGWLFLLVALFGVLDALFGFRSKRHLNSLTPL